MATVPHTACQVPRDGGFSLPPWAMCIQLMCRCRAVVWCGVVVVKMEGNRSCCCVASSGGWATLLPPSIPMNDQDDPPTRQTQPTPPFLSRTLGLYMIFPQHDLSLAKGSSDAPVVIAHPPRSQATKGILKQATKSG